MLNKTNSCPGLETITKHFLAIHGIHKIKNTFGVYLFLVYSALHIARWHCTQLFCPRSVTLNIFWAPTKIKTIQTEGRCCMSLQNSLELLLSAKITFPLGFGFLQTVGCLYGEQSIQVEIIDIPYFFNFQCSQKWVPCGQWARLDERPGSIFGSISSAFTLNFYAIQPIQFAYTFETRPVTVIWQQSKAGWILGAQLRTESFLMIFSAFKSCEVSVQAMDGMNKCNEEQTETGSRSLWANKRICTFFFSQTAFTALGSVALCCDEFCQIIYALFSCNV